MENEKLAAECFIILAKELASQTSKLSTDLVDQLKRVGLMTEENVPEKKDIKTILNRVLGMRLHMQEFFITKLLLAFTNRVFELKRSNQMDPETKGKYYWIPLKG